jgi:transposase
LVVIDEHSKWIEAVTVPSISSAATIKVLHNLFGMHGITSTEFRDFVQKNGVRHHTFSPYHPATNGLVEWAVEAVKAGLTKWI